MIVKQYIKDFENLGIGMFVHFGLYSLIGKGEWVRHLHNIPAEEYEVLRDKFAPKETWAKELVATAKKAGCKYITITARHHDGFSLYDTCGLSEFDAPHGCGRDLIREFVDACRENDIIPFFYHTLLDWHAPDYNADFPKYLEYLRKSVEILCKNYGKIGGMWFDGMWNKWGSDWEEDALYSMMRSYQPEMMIINNTGLDKRGALGHIELDSVTFEAGRPQRINLEGSPKYIASEMCQTLEQHWGYAKKDLNYKSLATLIEDLASCRKVGSNYLLNVGPMGDGILRPLDKALLETLGEWVEMNDESLRSPRPTDIKVDENEKDFVLDDGNGNSYLFVHDLGTLADPNVMVPREAKYMRSFAFDKKIKEVKWLDNGQILDFVQNEDKTSIVTRPYAYGENTVIRVAKIISE
ncbi:MAG: alpha-L-fucosidase [Ruminococcaceae bacterium]|nr:alpha-L-fucosidase [Oscillospiraceae bacterium]